jgi:hypothetical protein
MEKVTKILGYSVLILAFIVLPYLVVTGLIHVASRVLLYLFEQPLNALLILISVWVASSIIQKLVYGRRNA